MLTSVWLHKQELAAKRETPWARALRMPCTHLRKSLTISKSGLHNLGSVPSGKLSSWAGQEGALTSSHVRSNDERIAEESRVHTTPLEFNTNVQWKWFLDALSFIFLLKSNQEFWYPELGLSLHFKCVLFYFFFLFYICYFHYNKQEMWDPTLTNHLIITSREM